MSTVENNWVNMYVWPILEGGEMREGKRAGKSRKRFQDVEAEQGESGQQQ